MIFVAAGTSEMHFVSALDTVWGVQSILGLHETVCSGAADGYGRMARKPALTLLHLGPGLANALANFHNAHRAGTPILNVIGDMATWHKEADALLNMDVDALASTISKQVFHCGQDDDLEQKMTQACASALEPGQPGQSRVATIIVPHDVSWTRWPATPKLSSGRHRSTSPATKTTYTATREPVSDEVRQFIEDCAKALKACPRGKVAIYIGGCAALADRDALHHAGRAAAALGATLFCENAFTRLDRGAGLPVPRRLPYFPQDAEAAFGQFDVLVLADARRPVANFGYEGGPSQLINLVDRNVWELDSSDVYIPEALRLLSEAVGGSNISPLINCGGLFRPLSRPSIPRGRLNATSMCQIIAALQPEGAIIVDESLTSGNAYWDASHGCPSFSHMTLTGGAIGCGPPLALGAAIACPNRIVINIQADGSAMYSLQALWTQAREKLRVITVICANRSYAILKVEMAKQKISPSNGPAARALTELGTPPIDWVALAAGMGVAGVRVETCEQLADAFVSGLECDGPMLIEACL
jgi:acetolactate synthase I/II/III large subunit